MAQQSGAQQSRLAATAAAAIAASLTAGLAAPAMAQPVAAGEIDASYFYNATNATGHPVLYIYNNTAAPMGSAQLLARDVHGNAQGRTTFGASGIVAGSKMTYAFAGTGFLAANAATAGAQFEFTANGYSSGWFGDTGEPDWLGLDGHGFATPIFVADIYPVPEPAAMLLLSTGLIGLGAARRRRR